MLMLPFCGLASGEVKLVELASMLGTPSLLQGDVMRRSCACSDWRFAFFFLLRLSNEQHRQNKTEKKKRLKLGSSLASCRRGAQLADRLCDLIFSSLPSSEGAASRLLRPSRCWVGYCALKGGRRGKRRGRWQAQEGPWGSLCN